MVKDAQTGTRLDLKRSTWKPGKQNQIASIKITKRTLDRAMARGEGRDAALFFDTLAERYLELGDEQMSAHYVQLKQKYAQQGKISQEDMNYTLHNATQKRASNVQLVDASSLI